MAELRRTLADRFREYADVKTPEAIDRLIYKGREELEVRWATDSERGANAEAGALPEPESAGSSRGAEGEAEGRDGESVGERAAARACACE